MSGTPPISPEHQAVLEEHAKKHSSFATFQQEMNRLAEHIWHNVRSRGEQSSEEEAVLESGQVDESITEDTGPDEDPEV